MTLAIPVDEPFSVRSFLVGDNADRLAAVAQTVSETGLGRVAARAIRDTTDSARSAVGAEIIRTVDALLDLDLGGLLATGWTKHKTLTSAAEQTRAAPGTSAVVSLLEHSVSSTHRPRVDLLVREKRIGSVHLELSVRFTVRGLAATVRGGKLVSLTGGSCDINASLSVEEHELAHRTARADLPLVVRLGDGIPLGHGPAPGQDAPHPEPPAAPTSDSGYVVHLPGRDEPLTGR
jgi:hypothetical protein